MQPAVQLIIFGSTSSASGGVSAPVLSSAVGTATGATTADLSVSTTVGNGTLYWVVDTGSTPTAAQVKLGKGSGGAAADGASGNQAVSGTGSQTISGGATGLAPSTTYRVYFMHESSGAVQSSVAASSTFTTASATPVLSSPVGTATSSTTASLSVSTTIGNGTLYWIVDTGSTPSAAQVKLGQGSGGAAADGDSGSQSVVGTGSQTISGGATGLAPSTTYRAYFMHEATGPFQSTVATSATFTTSGAVSEELPHFTLIFN